MNKYKTKAYEIQGRTALKGEVKIPGAKNAALPAIVAAVLADETVTLENVPLELNDVVLLLDLIKSMGGSVEKLGKSSIKMNGKNINGGSLDIEKSGKIRHSLLLLGLSAAKGNDLFLPIPGGCKIGSRKHDLHLLAFDKLGYKINELEKGIDLKSSRYSKEREIDIEFHYPTFGGTLNVLFASANMTGSRVTLINPAKNPEVINVIDLLNSMGAKIYFDENGNIKIQGVEKLHGSKFLVMSDRIIAATMISAMGATKGKGLVIGAEKKYLLNEIAVWEKAGLVIESAENGLTIDGTGCIKPVNIMTEAYPGFHTDIQPFHGVLMLRAKGPSKISETILDGRFKYCNELNKLKANVQVQDDDFICVNGAQGQSAHFNFSPELEGSLNLTATDIRGGAAVVIGALMAEGKSMINNVYQIERGYATLPEMLNELGANIKRVY